MTLPYLMYREGHMYGNLIKILKLKAIKLKEKIKVIKFAKPIQFIQEFCYRSKS